MFRGAMTSGGPDPPQPTKATAATNAALNDQHFMTNPFDYLDKREVSLASMTQM